MADINKIVKEHSEMLSRNSGCATSLYAVVVAVLLLFAFAGCRTTEYIEVPVTHTEYVYRDRVDSVAVHDSVYVIEYRRDDTIRVVEFRYKDRFRYIQATDTVIQRDTVTVVRTQVVDRVEYRTRGVVKILAWLGVAGLLALAAYLYMRFKVFFRR